MMVQGRGTTQTGRRLSDAGGSDLLQRVRTSPDLPALPLLARRTLEMTREQPGGGSSRRLSEILEPDPDLASKVLQALNSGVYSAGTNFPTLDDAVLALGLRPVQILVIGFALVKSLMRGKPGGCDPEAHWRRSFYSATAARAIAGATRSPQMEACFLTGLLMDVGMLVLGQLLGEEYAKIVASAQGHAQLCDAERAALGTTHEEVGGVMAERWQLPATVRVPMGSHHHPAGVGGDVMRNMTEMVSLAGQCADVFVEEQPTEALTEVRRLCSERFGLSAFKADALLCDIGRVTRELTPVFAIPTDELFGYETVLQRAGDATISSPPAPAAPAPRTGERRRAPRIVREGFINVYPRDGNLSGPALRVGFFDVSGVGIRIIHGQPMTVGSEFILKVPQPGGKTVPMIYTIVRCELRGRGTFHIGAELIGILREMN